MYIDSSEWVMVPNVFGMATYSDGGLMSTKPYTCGSNYLLKMSNYKKGEWSETWDDLYWNFINKNREFFKKNPRMSMMVSMYDRQKLDKKNRDALIELVSLYGDVNVLKEAEKLLPQDQAIKSALQFLNQLDQALKNNQIKVSYDLSDIRGYQYHNGLVFSVYADQCYSPIALGGRYDNIGASFGRNRPATGFTMDLKNIVTLFPNGKKAKAILLNGPPKSTVIKKDNTITNKITLV